MKYIYALVFIIFICGLSFIAGWHYHKPEQIVKTVEIVKNIDRVIYRDYSKVNDAACIEILKKYDQTPFHQTFTVKELNPSYTDLSLKWDLYERNGEQEIKVPVYQSGNFKFYAGIGIGGLITGVAGYEIYKHILK